MSDTIAVILPTLGERDRLGYLAETLESVRDQRAEVDLLLVLVAPESAGEAIALAREHDARIVADPGQGISHAINLGIEAAGDATYYAWIGDDDLFRPGGLGALLARLEADPGAVLAYGRCDYIAPDGRLIFTNRAGRLARWLLPWGPDLVPHPGSLIRMDAIREAGCFDESLRFAMDLDLFLTLRRRGRLVDVPRSVSAFRWHGDSLTVSQRSRSAAEAQAVKRRHLPALLRPVSPVWEVPVRWASARTAERVSRRSR